MKNAYFTLQLSLPLIFLLTGCGSGASHVPPLWQMPTAIIGNSIGNSIYNAKRNTIKEYVTTHYESLKTEIQHGDGAHLDAVLNHMRVSAPQKQTAKNQLQKEYATMFKNIELTTDAVMNQYAHIYVANSSRKTKTTNGFSYTQARAIIDLYLSQNFEPFRWAIKTKDKTAIFPLLKALNITDTQTQNIFLDALYKQYDTYFIEPVVVGIMVLN